MTDPAYSQYEFIEKLREGLASHRIEMLSLITSPQGWDWSVALGNPVKLRFGFAPPEELNQKTVDGLVSVFSKAWFLDQTIKGATLSEMLDAFNDPKHIDSDHLLLAKAGLGSVDPLETARLRRLLDTSMVLGAFIKEVEEFADKSAEDAEANTAFLKRMFGRQNDARRMQLGTNLFFAKSLAVVVITQIALFLLLITML